MDFFVKLRVHHQTAVMFFAVIVYLVEAGEDSLWENNKLLDQLQRQKSAKYPKYLLKTKF